MNPDLLRLADHGGDVNLAVQTVGADDLIAADVEGLIRVRHDRAGVVGAHWAVNWATDAEQRNDLHLELTPAGADHLRSAS